MKRMAVFGSLVLLVLSLQAEDWVLSVKLGPEKGSDAVRSADPLSPGVQRLSADSPVIVFLRSMIQDDKGHTQNWVELAKAKKIIFWGEFSSLADTKVRFHFIWTGPEFRTLTTNWYSTKANTLSWVSVSTDTKWKKGIYSLTIIAQQRSLGSGLGCVRECIFKLL
ncbi:MAG: hypothetical protein JW736_01130 [Deltaproteobacteria bacterium]|nr:hypothetical protein [Deltaproteobacteria bacterium]